jgi:hypothetical protein
VLAGCLPDEKDGNLRRAGELWTGGRSCAAARAAGWFEPVPVRAMAEDQRKRGDRRRTKDERFRRPLRQVAQTEVDSGVRRAPRGSAASSTSKQLAADAFEAIQSPRSCRHRQRSLENARVRRDETRSRTTRQAEDFDRRCRWRHWLEAERLLRRRFRSTQEDHRKQSGSVELLQKLGSRPPTLPC